MNQIMIVDDSKTSRMFIKMCLEIVLTRAKEITFLEAENGKEALAILNEKTVDLVIMDLNMPLMDGTTLMRWIKDNGKLSTLPVIVITSTDNMAKRNELADLGALHVLSKPVSPAKLTPIIKSILNQPDEPNTYGA